MRMLLLIRILLIGIGLVGRSLLELQKKFLKHVVSLILSMIQQITDTIVGY